MIATLRYTLPEERAEHAAALAGMDALGALAAIDTHLRNAIKHGEHSAETTAALQAVRDLLHAECEGLPL
jgi:DNA-binding GntR family transcriptional regulator